MRGSGLRAAQFTLLATLIQTGPMPATRSRGLSGARPDDAHPQPSSASSRRPRHDRGQRRPRVREVTSPPKARRRLSAPIPLGEGLRTPRWRGRGRSKKFWLGACICTLTRSSRHVRNSVSHRINRKRFDRRRLSVARARANLARAPDRRRRSRWLVRACSRDGRDRRARTRRGVSALPDWA